VGEATALPIDGPVGNKALSIVPIDLQPGAPVYVVSELR
jgi:hypothetical protein